jgi:uncharacterized protein YegJ (DUF2314 family)
LVLVVAAAVYFAKSRHASDNTAETDAQKWEREHNLIDPANDPRFKAAEAEAMRRWPEFASAFTNRQPGDNFAAKAKFVEGNMTEWMWVEVATITASGITGKLANDPVHVKNVKDGDAVSKPLSEIDDWIISRKGEIVAGGFTTKVFEQIEKERVGKK